MIAAFKTRWGSEMSICMANQHTYFPEKLLASLFPNYHGSGWYEFLTGVQNADNVYECTNGNYHMKHHTFREDVHDRWKVGMDIHFVINNRTPKYFQFAPIFKVVGIQKLRIQYTTPDGGRWALPQIYIDGQWLPDLETLVQNDGFDSVEDFCHFFKDDWSGKIIHWTDLKY